jgi:hypothetical protein
MSVFCFSTEEEEVVADALNGDQEEQHGMFDTAGRVSHSSATRVQKVADR